MLPAITSDEMSNILQRCGARRIAQTDHGQLFAVRRRLILLRHSQAVASNDLHDILRSASISAGSFSEMLADVRAAIVSRRGGMTQSAAASEEGAPVENGDRWWREPGLGGW